MIAWHEEPIGKHHDRKSFDCGDAGLNDFLQRYARQSHEQGGSKTFLAIDDADGKTVLGFYSLAPTSIRAEIVPDDVKRGLARHEVPGFRLTRLAVDTRLQGQGMGGQLLLAAGKRCLRVTAEVGGVVMAIDAKNGRVADWYKTYSAIPLLDAPLSLVIPLATIAAALQAVGGRS
ncbi:GNAT family N-acetyltransferase [Rhizobium sp. R339]|uniref:GNAT family N-acetyltransferase n=1 Tax=Rhizobium sp. R339 TaxID=1764273 RepID=UPI001AECB424|nr:GNAT family N-acetyltransferase [Rhizobium sp. R339]